MDFPLTNHGREFFASAFKRIRILLISLFVPLVYLQAQEVKGNRRVMEAVYAESKITIDGVLDEPAWKTAQPAKDFIQKDPSQGEPASEWTEVRILYDKKNLYIGAFCHERSLDHIIVRDITRDFPVDSQDTFSITLDTFHDHRNGYAFVTNPRGGERDMQIFNDARDVNFNWDGAWEIKSRIQADGWTVEMAIPFKTLRFSKGKVQVWGINLHRRIRYRNESSWWSPLARHDSNARIAPAGHLAGLEDIQPGRNLQIKPFALTGIKQFASRGKGTEGDFDGGLDLKYGLTPGLTLDLTLNTDFSHVEADVQQVNLTRFPLFFPEKREFFLENAGLFQLGETYRLGPPRNNEIIPFFSRKIGLTSDGEPVPILGGLRLTGRAGHYQMGLLNIQTRSQAAVPANNFTVARFRRDILANSDLGVMFINRQSRQPNDYNRTFGADINFVFFRDLKINALLGKTRTPGLHGNDSIGKVEAQWQSNLVRLLGSYLDIQKNFRPEVGFVRRPGRRILHHEFGLQHRLQRETRLGSFIRDIFPLLISDYAIVPDGKTEIKLFRPQLHIDFQDGSGFEAQYTQNFERLSRPFPIPIRRDVTVPIGDYRFNEFSVQYFTNKSKAISGDAQYQKGDYYNGQKTTLTLGGNFQPSYRFYSSVNYERNDLKLPNNSFTTDLLNLRVNYSFSPKMFLNALIQYNSATNQVSSNIRFRFIHHPLSDLYVVYNEQRDIRRNRNDRTLTLKYTHLLYF